MRLRIEICLDNAAFEDAPEQEIRRILRSIYPPALLPHKCKIPGGCGEEHGVRAMLRDSNGNTVGVAEVVEE